MADIDRRSRQTRRRATSRSTPLRSGRDPRRHRVRDDHRLRSRGHQGALHEPKHPLRTLPAYHSRQLVMNAGLTPIDLRQPPRPCHAGRGLRRRRRGGPGAELHQRRRRVLVPGEAGSRAGQEVCLRCGLQEEAGSLAHQLANNTHRGRTTVAEEGGRCAQTAWINRPKVEEHVTREVGTSQDRPGLFHYRCTLLCAAHLRRRRSWQGQRRRKRRNMGGQQHQQGDQGLDGRAEKSASSRA